MSSARVRNADSLTPLAQWPKLYRRLFAYFKDGNNGLRNFDAWLRADSGARDDRVWIISRGEQANMHDLVDVKGNRIKMTYWPEDIVIDPR